MKTIDKYKDEICNLDMSYSVKLSADKVLALYHFRAAIEQFSRENPYEGLTFGYDKIEHLTDERHVTTSFLRAFGGEWKKEPNTYYPDKIDYVQKIPHPFKTAPPAEEGEEPNKQPMFTIVCSSPPPPSCIVEEYEEEVPATKIKRKRVVCPQSVAEELAEVST